MPDIPFIITDDEASGFRFGRLPLWMRAGVAGRRRGIVAIWQHCDMNASVSAACGFRFQSSPLPE
jgi:hypothetical protein